MARCWDPTVQSSQVQERLKYAMKRVPTETTRMTHRVSITIASSVRNEALKHLTNSAFGISSGSIQV